MWINEGLGLIERVFPSMVPRVNGFNGNEWTAKGLHDLALCCNEFTPVSMVIKEADRLGLWVEPDGNIVRR